MQTLNEPGCVKKQRKEHPPTPLLYEQGPAPRSGVFVRRKNTRTRTPPTHTALPTQPCVACSVPRLRASIDHRSTRDLYAYTRHIATLYRYTRHIRMWQRDVYEGTR